MAVRAHLKTKGSQGINQRSEKPALPDKLRGSTGRSTKCDGARRATDTAAGPTPDSLSLRRTCSSDQSFHALLIQHRHRVTGRHLVSLHPDSAQLQKAFK